MITKIGLELGKKQEYHKTEIILYNIQVIQTNRINLKIRQGS